MGLNSSSGLALGWEHSMGCDKEALLCGIPEVWMLGREVQGKEAMSLWFPQVTSMGDRQRTSFQTKSPRYQRSEPSLPPLSAVPGGPL